MRTPKWQVWHKFFVGRLGGRVVPPTPNSKTTRRIWDVNGRRIQICTGADGTEEVWYRLDPFSTPDMTEAFVEVLCRPPVDSPARKPNRIETKPVTAPSWTPPPAEYKLLALFPPD